MECNITTGSAGELCEKLRRIKLKDGKTQPYLDSYISIEMLDPAILAPTQRYCLIKEIKKIEQLRWSILNDYGWDILQLNGYLRVEYTPPLEGAENGTKVQVSNYDSTKTIDIIPPVIEEYIDPRGGVQLIINDGQHRCRLAYQMGMPINVVYIRGANKSYPYYAYPLPNGWNDVELRDDIPLGYVKKFHVIREHKRLYRDFNTQFNNIGDSRSYTKETKVGETGPIGQCTSGFNGSDKGIDPEVAKSQLKKEMEDVKLGEYGIIGSPYDPEGASPYKKVDKELSLLESIVHSSCDPGTELGKALDTARKSFNEYKNRIDSLNPGEKLGEVKIDFDELFEVYKSLSPEVKKEFEEIRNNLSRAGRTASDSFLSLIEKFLGEDKK